MIRGFRTEHLVSLGPPRARHGGCPKLGAQKQSPGPGFGGDCSVQDCRRKWQPTPLFLPGESQGWGSLVGCRLWGPPSGALEYDLHPPRWFLQEASGWGGASCVLTPLSQSLPLGCEVLTPLP